MLKVPLHLLDDWKYFHPKLQRGLSFTNKNVSKRKTGGRYIKLTKYFKFNTL